MPPFFMHKRAENMHKTMYIHLARGLYKNHCQFAQFICAICYIKAINYAQNNSFTQRYMFFVMKL